MSVQHQPANDHPPAQVDIAIITALREELEPILNLLGGAQHWQTFLMGNFRHYYAQFVCGDRALSIAACALWKSGSDATAAAVQRLQILRPRLIVMTGICAGWHARDIQLGDIIIAERAFHVGIGKETNAGFQADTHTYQPPPWLVQWLIDFSHSDTDVWFKSITTIRPLSLDYQAELLLCLIAQSGASLPLSEADWQTVQTHRIDYPQAQQHLQEQKFLTRTGKLTASAKQQLKVLREHNFGKLIFSPDHDQPRVHCGAFASTEAVMAIEEPFHAPAQHVRKVLAIDLEVASFYQIATELGIPAFAVKGVSDYGTPKKDDAFHAYAAEAAARWMHAFICAYAGQIDIHRPEDAAERATPAQSLGTASTNSTFGNTKIGGSVDTYQQINIADSNVQGPIIGSQITSINRQQLDMPTSLVDLCIDVAVPDRVCVNEVFAAAILVRPPKLPALQDDQIDFVKTGVAGVVWPESQPYISLGVRIWAPDCTIHNSDHRSFRLYPGRIAPILYFNLTSRKVGINSITVELYQQDDTIGSTRVQTLVGEQPVGKVKVDIVTQLMSSDASVSQEEIDNQFKLLAAHRQRLMSYLLRRAKVGSAFAPPDIDQGIREACHDIRRCKAFLRGWGVLVYDYPDDEVE